MSIYGEDSLPAEITRPLMKNFVTASVIVVSVLLTGFAVSLIAREKVWAETQTASGSFATGSGSAMGLYVDPLVSSGSKAIWIFLGTQVALLTESGVVIKSYQISSGAPATPTPLGVFKIYKKEELRVSGQAVPYRMPNYMSFTKNSAFGLHGLPYLGDSAKASSYWSEALSHIGIPVSHGCVRFLPEEAIELYKWADRGIPVFIQT